jgi:hypothetical protein
MGICVGCHLSFLLENILLRKRNIFMNKNIEYIFNLTSELNTQHDSIYIPRHIIAIYYNFFIGLFWMHSSFQGTDEGIRVMVLNNISNTI